MHPSGHTAWGSSTQLWIILTDLSWQRGWQLTSHGLVTSWQWQDGFQYRGGSLSLRSGIITLYDTLPSRQALEPATILDLAVSCWPST